MSRTLSQLLTISAACVASLVVATNAHAQDPVVSYRTHIDAFNARDTESFLSHYQPSFCFHNSESTPEHLRETLSAHFAGEGNKIKLLHVELLARVERQAVVWSVFEHGARPVTRLLAMTETEEGWRIAAETSPTRLRCAPGLLDGVEPDIRAIVLSAAAQVAKVGDVIEGAGTVEGLQWDDLYCPPGTEPVYDEWGDHDFGTGGSVEYYCRVADVHCEGDVELTAPMRWFEVEMKPQCDSDTSGQVQFVRICHRHGDVTLFCIQTEQKYQMAGE